MIYTFETMGTVASIEPPRMIGELERIFSRFDRTFSLYRPESELSAIAAGSLLLADSSAVVRDAYAIALEWRSMTGGAFTPHRPDGVIDLSGVVKALAMESAGRMLGTSSEWILNVGGDVLASGGRVTVGVVDPGDRRQLLTSLVLDDERHAVATSGSAERGEHIWGRGGFVQVTVLASDIVTADVLATAIAAGGTDTLNDATARWDIDVLAIDPAGNLFATPGIRARLAGASALAN